MADRTPIAILQRFVDILNAGDAQHLSEIYAENYVQHNAVGPSGRAAVIAYFAEILSAFPGARVTLEDAITDGSSIAGRFTQKGVHSGTFRGIAPTGREVEIRTIDIWRVRDGMLSEHWGETNFADVLAQLRGSANSTH